MYTLLQFCSESIYMYVYVYIRMCICMWYRYPGLFHSFTCYRHCLFHLGVHPASLAALVDLVVECWPLNLEVKGLIPIQKQLQCVFVFSDTTQTIQHTRNSRIIIWCRLFKHVNLSTGVDMLVRTET